MKKITTFFRSSVTLVLLLLLSNHITAQTYVNIPGSFNSEMGCPGDWQPDCTNDGLTYNNGTGLWEGTFNLPAGSWEYKVAIDHSWNENYGANGVQNGPNIPLILPSAMAVTFTYNPVTHFVTNSLNNQPLTVVIPGSFQSELGCASDWDPTCTAISLTYDPASGEWYGANYLPPGTWEYKVAINNSWTENYGVGGVLNGSNYSITLSNYTFVYFRYNAQSHVLNTAILNNLVTAVGSFQSKAGCGSDWMPDCFNTTLQFDYSAGLWKGKFLLPAGNYEFKIATEFSWNENYGAGGVLNGPSIPFSVPSVSFVEFTFNPFTHVPSYNVSPITVVIPGDFQSELGCTPNFYNGDWEPACDFTRLTYDPAQRLFVGTWNVGAGHWEYKVAINNSWAENYGLYGQRDGPNIPLDLKFPCQITFKYDPYSHIVSLDYITTYVCVNKFYDANVSGYQDYNEQNLAGVTFTLTGNGVSQTQITGSDGSACFGNLKPGTYTIKETKPAGYYTTTGDSQTDSITSPLTANFGNVCLGAGGAKGIGFWTSKNGETALNNSGQLENILWYLRYFGLRNADGSDFDPYTYAQLKTWMLNANAKNMMNMLSAQLAAMYISTQLGYVNLYSSYIYTPGCGFWGNGNFMDVNTLIWYTNYLLWFNTTVTGKSPDRIYIDCLKTGFDNANNNFTFVQPKPCGAVAPLSKRPAADMSIISTETEAKVWPNPTHDYFILRPSNNSNSLLTVRVMDINGKEVYKTTGVAASDYKFGQQFKTGLYFVEITQGEKRTTIKVVKQ